MGRAKYLFYPEKGYLKDQYIAPDNQNAKGKVKRYLLTSYNVNDVIERAPRDENGNVTLMAQGAKQEFILHIAT